MSELNTGFIRPNRIVTPTSDPGINGFEYSSTVFGDASQLFAGGTTDLNQYNVVGRTDFLAQDHPYIESNSTSEYLTLGFPDLNIPAGSIITNFEYVFSGFVLENPFTTNLYQAGPPSLIVRGPNPDDGNALASSTISVSSAGSLFINEFLATSNPPPRALVGQNRISVSYGPGSAFEAISDANPAYNIVQSLVGDVGKLYFQFSFNDFLASGMRLYFNGSDTGFASDYIGISTDNYGSNSPNNPTPSVRVSYIPPLGQSSKIIISGNTKAKIAPKITYDPILYGFDGGPKNYIPLGTSLNDGNNYGDSPNFPPTNILSTGAGSAISSYSTQDFTFFAQGVNRHGALLYNFLNPSSFLPNSLITGISVIAGPDFDGGGSNSRISSFGGNGSATFRFECYLYNGTEFSERLSWDPVDLNPNITLLNGNKTAEFTGGNTHYKNNDVGEDVLFGGPNDLSGLDWDPTVADSWGFAIACTSTNGNAQGGVTRGLKLRVHFKQIDESIPTKVVLGK